MMGFIKAVYYRQAFQPNFFGLLINPFFIIRRALFLGVKRLASSHNGGKLLDIGCGSKPYENLFNVDEYFGIDVEVSGHDHRLSKVDKFYNGRDIPFPNDEFDIVFSSEVFEHIFDIDYSLSEVYRVLNPGGKLILTCPFFWPEHEQPFDFGRYTSFGIEHLLKKHGFSCVSVSRSTGHFATLVQMLSAYISMHIFPKNPFLRIALNPLFIAPLNAFGILLSPFMPESETVYHNLIVTARKGCALHE